MPPVLGFVGKAAGLVGKALGVFGGGSAVKGALTLGATAFNVADARGTAKQAAAAEIAGQERAADFLERSRVENLARLDPFIEGSGAALDQQRAISGVAGPEAQQKFFDDFQRSPFSEFQQREGLKVIGQQTARGGTLRSGSRLKKISQFINDLTSRDIQTQFNQAGDIARTGLTAAGAAAGVETAARTGQANLAVQGGQSESDRTIARSSALQSGVADLFARTQP